MLGLSHHTSGTPRSCWCARSWRPQQQQVTGLRQAGSVAGGQGVVPQGPSGIVAVGDVTAQQAGQDHEERDEKWAIIPETPGYGEVRNI